MHLLKKDHLGFDELIRSFILGDKTRVIVEQFDIRDFTIYLTDRLNGLQLILKLLKEALYAWCVFDNDKDATNFR